VEDSNFGACFWFTFISIKIVGLHIRLQFALVPFSFSMHKFADEIVCRCSSLAAPTFPGKKPCKSVRKDFKDMLHPTALYECRSTSVL
jgi:hypothetical protein